MRVFKKLIKDKRGSSNLITFIAMLPVLIAFVLAIAQVTVIGVSQSVINNAAFEGARAGARSSSPVEDAIKAANEYGSSILHNWNSRATVKAIADDTTITVTVRYIFPKYAYFNMKGTNIGSTIQASSSQLLEDRP